MCIHRGGERERESEKHWVSCTFHTPPRRPWSRYGGCRCQILEPPVWEYLGFMALGF